MSDPVLNALLFALLLILNNSRGTKTLPEEPNCDNKRLGLDTHTSHGFPSVPSYPGPHLSPKLWSTKIVKSSPRKISDGLIF